MSFLSFLEVDKDGNVNVSKLGKKPYLTAGCGGFVDITANARKIVFSGYFEAGAKLDLTEEALAAGATQEQLNEIDQEAAAAADEDPIELRFPAGNAWRRASLWLPRVRGRWAKRPIPAVAGLPDR